MNNAIEAIIYMEPVGKARARTDRIKSKSGKMVTVSHTPDKTAHAENIIRDSLMRSKVMFGPDTPLKVIVNFIRSRPGHPKNKDYPVTKPDMDNYYKLLTDAANKFVYPDDAQIVTVVMRKRFIKPGQVPRIELYICEEKI